MPGSFRYLDALIADRISLDFPNRETTMILDVGAGAGKYRDLLWDYPSMYAVEAHLPYIKQYNLKERYTDVFHQNIKDGIFIPQDALVIFGDVLEHLSVQDAQLVLKRCEDKAVLVAVPFNYEQDAIEGVIWERHLQPDLTHEVFMERYPGFDCLARDEYYGVYVRDPQSRWTLNEVIENPYVLVAYRTSDWRNYTQLTMSLWQLQQHHLQHKLAPLALMSENGARADTAMNKIISKFMNWPENDSLGKPTHLLSVDSDQGFRPEDLGRLLEHRAQIVGVPIRKKTQELAWTISGIPEVGGVTYWNGSLLEIGGIGCGFTLYARSAIERLCNHYDHLTSIDEDGVSLCRLCQVTDLGEDLELCRKWRNYGGKIWADPKLEICHVGMAEFTGKLIDHMKLESRFTCQTRESAA